MNTRFKASHIETLLIILTLVLSFQAKASERLESAFDVMTFADSFECNDKFPHHSFCSAVEFKPWSKEEKQLVGDYLKSFNDPRLAYFLKTIKEKGITKIHRVGYSAGWYSNTQERRVEFFRSADNAILWVNPVTNMIGFTDRFFKGTKFFDPYAQRERKQLNILHELFHVFDLANNHISSEKEFQIAARWKWNGQEHVIDGVDYDKAKQDFQGVLDLVRAHKASEAYLLDRKIGILKGYPTLYSMMNSHETFAEIMSYFILDPTAPSYMSLEMQAYCNKVLKVP